MKTDCYKYIHKLLRLGKSEEVLQSIYSKNLNKLKEPYDEDSNHGWYIIGCIYYNKGEHDHAIAAFKKSLSFRNDDDEALMALSNCYSAINRPNIAEKYIREAIAIRGEDDRYIYNLANCLFDQNLYDEAAKLYDSVSRDNKKLHKKARKNYMLARSKNEAR